MTNSPVDLRVNGDCAPLGIDQPPLLSWTTPESAVGSRVVVSHKGHLIWESGPLPSGQNEVTYEGPGLISRSIYDWTVVARHHSGIEYSCASTWETGLIDPNDWQAQWISRFVPASHRVHRTPDGRSVDWAQAGETLTQSFITAGDAAAVSLNLSSPPTGHARAQLRLRDGDRRLIAERELVSGDQPWDWYGNFLDLREQTAPPGIYTLELEVLAGRLGWYGSQSGVVEAASSEPLGPVTLTGRSTRNGEETAWLRTVAVDVDPAPNPRFRKRFDLPDRFRSARLYAVGLGYGIFRINRTAVTDAVLQPPQTDYRKRVLTRSYDVTALVEHGSNSIDVELGRGFYSSRGADTWGWFVAPWHREPTTRVQLEVEDQDGRRIVIGTNDSWLTAPSSIRRDRTYTGIHEGDPIEEWESAIVVPGPAGELVNDPTPAIYPATPLTPIESSTTDGAVVHDFGVTIAGTIRLTLQASGPGSVTVRYGEMLDAQNAPMCDNGCAVAPAQQDVLDIHEAGTVVWQPAFTYKGFRWASVELTEHLEAVSVEAVPFRTDLLNAGTMTSSNPTFEWMGTATRQTLLNNIHGIPTDTPTFEKNGWTGDGHLIAEAAMHYFDLRRTFGKWIDDHADAQDDRGHIPQIIPSPGWGRRLDPTWSSSNILIPWALYNEYGDPSDLRRWLPMMRRYLDAALDVAVTNDWIWPLHSWGDWLAPGHLFAPEGPAPTATAFLAHSAGVLAAICEVLGLPEGTEYQGAARRIADAYHDRYFDETTGGYTAPAAGYRQGMNVLPLAFGLVPEEHRSSVFGSLVRDIEERTAGHLDCGAVSLKYLLPVLSRFGRDDLAVTVATQPTGPSWEAWRRTGSDTLFEAWDDGARSRNHYFFGAAAWWVHRRVGGLEPLASGWKKVSFDPIDDDRVQSAQITHRTPAGLLTARWERQAGQLQASLTIPSGIDVMLPDGRSLTAGDFDVRLPIESADATDRG